MAPQARRLCWATALGITLCACGSGDESCGSVPVHSIESGTYASDGEPGSGPYDCSGFPDGEVAKTMEVDRAANEVRITYTRSTGEQVVEVWRITGAYQQIL